MDAIGLPQIVAAIIYVVALIVAFLVYFFLIRKKEDDAATQSVTALKGLICKPAMPVTIEAMNDAIASHGAKARGLRRDEAEFAGALNTPNDTSRVAIAEANEIIKSRRARNSL